VRTLQMVGIGLVLVFAMILARYRRLAPSIAAFAPAILASATSIAIVALFGQELNLMHLVALLLVLSMGEDYGVFMVEAHGAGDDIGNAMSSVLLACVTTVLSFGLLAMSSNPALRALGSITGLGVLLSFVLTPMGWLFLKAKKPDTR
jgi:predicted exporter